MPLRIYREVGVHRRDLGVRLRVRLRRSKTSHNRFNRSYPFTLDARASVGDVEGSRLPSPKALTAMAELQLLPEHA